MNANFIADYTRRQLQTSLRNFREQGFTTIKLNEKNSKLRAELRRVYKEIYKYTFCKNLASRNTHEVKALWANLKERAMAKKLTAKEAESFVSQTLTLWDREGYETAYNTFLVFLFA